MEVCTPDNNGEGERTAPVELVLADVLSSKELVKTVAVAVARVRVGVGRTTAVTSLSGSNTVVDSNSENVDENDKDGVTCNSDWVGLERVTWLGTGTSSLDEGSRMDGELGSSNGVEKGKSAEVGKGEGERDLLDIASGMRDEDMRSGVGDRRLEKRTVVRADVGSAVKGRRKPSDTGSLVDSGKAVSESGSRMVDEDRKGIGVVSIPTELINVTLEVSCRKTEVVCGSNGKDNGRVDVCGSVVKGVTDTSAETAGIINVELGDGVTVVASDSVDCMLAEGVETRGTRMALENSRSWENDGDVATSTDVVLTTDVCGSSVVEVCEGTIREGVRMEATSVSGRSTEVGSSKTGENVVVVVATSTDWLASPVRAVDVIPNSEAIGELAILVLARDGTGCTLED